MSTEHGTIGHSDRDEWYTINEGGYTLLYVTLFRGRNISKPVKDPTIAEGLRITCMMASHIGRIPPKGTRVLVSMPDKIPGHAMGVVTATIEKNQTVQLSKDRAVLDLGDQDYVIKARSITLMDNENRFVCLGPDTGAMVQDTDGSGLMVKGGAVVLMCANGGNLSSLIQLKSDEVTAHVNGGSMLQLNQTKATMFGINCYVQGAGVYLGAVPTALTSAVYCNVASGTPTPPNTVGMLVGTGISTTVYISP